MDNTNARFNVSATDSMSDEPLVISITGLTCHQKHTLHSWIKSDNNNIFECVVIYESDGNGTIDLSKDSAIGGMYSGVEPMGLFWAMESSPVNKKRYNRLAKLDVETPQVHNFVVYDNIVDNLDEFYQLKSKGQLNNLASTQVNRWFMAKGTKRSLLTVEKHGIHGTLFIPSGEGPFPGIISMFGGFPGTMEYRASLYASHGYAAIALAFYGAPGLPEVKSQDDQVSESYSLNLEYFEKSVKFLLDHGNVDRRCGIAVVGSSSSGAIALCMASLLDAVRCVIWTNATISPYYAVVRYKGEIVYTPAPIKKDLYMKEFRSSAKYRQVYHTPKSYLDKKLANLVPKFYEKQNIAYLFIASLSDNTIPSEYEINQAEKLLKMTNHPNYKLIRCAGSGHLMEPPHTICNCFHGTFGKPYFANWGGIKLPHCRNQEKVWKEHLAFLKSNLRPPISKL